MSDLALLVERIQEQLADLQMQVESIPREPAVGIYSGSGSGGGLGCIGVYDFKLSPQAANHTDGDGVQWKLCDGASYPAASYTSAHAVASGLGFPYGGTSALVNAADFRDRFVVMPGYDIGSVGQTDGRSLFQRNPIQHLHSAGTLNTFAASAHTHAGSGLFCANNSTGVSVDPQNGSVDVDQSSYMNTACLTPHGHSVSDPGHIHGISGTTASGGAHTHGIYANTGYEKAWPAYGAANWFQRFT